MVLSIICWFGFPLNFEIIYRIVYDNVLRRKPRYVIQLFVNLSSLLTLFTTCTQICHFIFRRNAQFSNQLCYFYVSIIGVACANLFFNTLVWLIDSFVMINFPMWYERKVTPRRVVFWLTILNLVLAVAMKWMFIGRVLPIACAIQTKHALTLRVTLLSLVLFCILFLLLNFVSVWNLLPQVSRAVPVGSRPSTNGVPAAQHHLEESEMVRFHPLAAPLIAALVVAPTQQGTIDIPTEDQSDHTLRQLELEAKKMFLVSFIPLLLLPFPGLVFVFSYYKVCLQSNPTAFCEDFTWLIPYMPIVFSLHALINPIMSLKLNKDFAPHSLIRAFRMWCLISICSFHACFFLITVLTSVFH